MISGTEGKIADKDIHASSFCERAWKQSPGHPNSMQRQKTQEHDAGETAREHLTDIRKVLCLRRTDKRQ
jgi:hypothetical protein